MSKSILKMDLENMSLETRENIHQNSTSIIKEEVNNIIIDIKPENIGSELDSNLEQNVFENVQLEIKKEVYITPNCVEENLPLDIASPFYNEDPNSNKNLMHTSLTNEYVGLEFKNETEDECYDYAGCDDRSIDSNEVMALNNVEACLTDDGSLKNENEPCEENIKEDPDNIKQETDFTVTETHLISNKVINTTSTITNPQEGIIQSHTTKTLVMEIRPMGHDGSVPIEKMGNPEEILPTSHNNYDYYIINPFQLNSITGNALPLEQELLKAGRTEDGLNPYNCLKCPNSYKSLAQLKRHIKIHEAIENREMGYMKSAITRKENKNKKIPSAKVKKKIDYKVTIAMKARKERLEKRLKAKEKLQESVLKKEVKEIKEEVKEIKDGYKCTCGQVYRRKSRMKTCLQSHDIADRDSCFSCITCTKQFTNQIELSLHRKRLHRKRFCCKFCPTDFKTRKKLFKHLKIHQKVQLMEYKVISEVVQGKQKMRCFMCSKTFSELSELKYHVMEDHQEPYVCPHCKETFKKIIDFGNHTKTLHPEVEGQSVLDVLEAFSKLVQAWKCEECGLQFHEADKLAMHQIEKHSPDLKDKNPFQCPDCRRVFVSQKGLTSHRRIHHSTESIEESETVEKGVMCVECRKICKDMEALTSHMRLHSPERKYPCKFCDFRFATPEKRKVHAELHTGDMKYVCFICEYQCSSENRLKLHKMSDKHLNMKELLLTGKPVIEEQSTSKKEERKAKKRKETQSDSSSSEEREATCDVCGDNFPSEGKMLEHKQTHPFIEFPNEDKPTRIFFK